MAESQPYPDWTCEKCTLINVPKSKKCKVCKLGRRPYEIETIFSGIGKGINSLLNMGATSPAADQGATATPPLTKQSNEKTRSYSNCNESNPFPNKKRHSSKFRHSKHKLHTSQNSGSVGNLMKAFQKDKTTHKNDKICIGDKVRINATNSQTQQQLKNAKGTVMYIGYPYIGRSVRYGIHLESTAIGDNDGTLMLDIKTGKLAKPSHIEKYKKRIKKRKFFKSKTNHGIFVKKQNIISIDRLATSPHRFTINDAVEVRFRGNGTIKFVGSLEHVTKEMGVWYGIHLEVRKGRHDGTVNGVKYFECPPQYGLHCRQNHLTLIEPEHKDSEETNDEEDDTDSNLYINGNRPRNGGSYTAVRNGRPRNNGTFAKNRKSTDTRPRTQKSSKWAKLMGVTDASTIKGFKQPYQSAMTLAIPGSLSRRTSPLESQPMSPEFPLRLVSLSSIKQQQSDSIREEFGIGKMVSISEIIPRDAFRPALSVHVLPGMVHKKKSVSTTHKEGKQSGVQGKTTVVLPGYYQGLKKRKFFDFFDFDEIEDELGEGEFGVVYKCRPIDVEDENEESITFHTQFTQTRNNTLQKQYTFTESGSLYPGGPPSDSDGSYDSSSSDEDEVIYAVKKIKKAKFHHLNYQAKQEAIKLLQQEIKLLEKIQRLKSRKLPGSEYVIDLMDVFEDRNYLYIVTNFCAGGNLWQYIEEDADMSEQTIQQVMKQILAGLTFLHSNNMAHLDLKPDNIMFDKDKQIQLIDFGMSRVIPPLTKQGVLVGTPNFVAPEVLNGFYDMKADIWSVGVLFFMLRFGHPPFFEGNDKMDSSLDGSNLAQHSSLFEQIKNGFEPVVKDGLGPWFPSHTAICEQLQDLLSKMLCTDLSGRYTAAECLAHPYFAQLADNKQLPLTVLNAFTRFSGQCRFKVMISRLFAHQIEPKQMQQLKETWQKFDADGDGSLTLEQFKKVMTDYDTGYRDYQIEAIFESLDWNETETINFDALVTAFSYQRLVAVDERLWEAFARLDDDNDGHITKAEIKRVLAMVNPTAFDAGIKELENFQPQRSGSGGSVLSPPVLNDTDSMRREAFQAHQKKISVFIGDCIVFADWDDDGQIDYEEFLRAIHPKFTEPTITPRAMQSPSQTADSPPKKFIFQPSLAAGHMAMGIAEEDETNRNGFEKYTKMEMNENIDEEKSD